MTADLRALLGRTAFADATDADLLARYAGERDDVAFAELVHRHAPAVYAACRRFLSDPASLDDAFQAVFVLLSRKAAGLAHPDKLSGWLCGAAGRIARKLRDRTAKRATTETSLEGAPEPAAVEADHAELKTVLDEELTRLPSAYREAVLLCDVQGLPRRIAAKQLGLPESTLSNRLTRARAMLGSRLVRRGVALGAWLTLTVVSIASVPARLVTLTVSQIAADAVPPHLLSLASEGAIPVIPFKSAGVVLAAVVMAGLAFVPLMAQEPVKAPPVAKQLADPPDPEPEEIPAAVYSGAYSRDGKLFALTSDFYRPRDKKEETKKVLRLYDTATWKLIHTLDAKDICHQVVFSADGGTLYAACYDGSVYTWDTKTGKAGATLSTKADSCHAVAVSPDGKVLASGHYTAEGKVSEIHLWDTATNKPLRTISGDEQVSSSAFAFSPDGKVIATGCHASHGKGTAADFHGVIEWDVATGKEVKRFDTPRNTPGATPIVCTLAYTKDGKRLLVAGGESVPSPKAGGSSCVGYLWVLDRKSGEVERTLVVKCQGDYVREAALSPDGSKLYAGLHTPPRQVVWKGRVSTMSIPVLQCWDTETWDLDWSRESEPEVSGATGVVVSPSGKRVGVADTAGFTLLDAKTGDPKGGLVKVAPPK